ncbi:MAG: diaminopimelate epimerase [Bdellovibrionales bacterium]|nr:diaminopimelate epimerase [Bdellovibrionales bacterium]
MKSSLDFFKVEAAGNDFILIPQSPQGLPWLQDSKASSRIQALCHAHTGIAADGLLCVWPEGGAWQWRFWNSDGSEADMCGNAARAVTLWLAQTLPPGSDLSWQASRTVVHGRLDSQGRPEVRWSFPQTVMAPPQDIREAAKNLAGENLDRIFLVNSGVPHLVLLGRGLWPAHVRTSTAPFLRSHPSLGSAGANVTFVAQPHFETVSFERGVEAETLACGSGAMAAFLALESLGAPFAGRPLQFKFPGGTLQVSRQTDGVWLAGPARIVFKGQTNVENFE